MRTQKAYAYRCERVRFSAAAMKVGMGGIDGNVRCERLQERKADRNRPVDFRRCSPARIARYFSRLITEREALSAKRDLLRRRQRVRAVLAGRGYRRADLERPFVALRDARAGAHEAERCRICRDAAGN